MSKPKFAIASALRERLAKPYHKKDLIADLMAGLVVGLVAIPLGMALAIATGVPPQFGLYTVIISGMLVALLGGSRFQVTGPTAAFVVILAPIVAKFGIGGLLVAGLMSGVILVIIGISGLGQLISYIPYPVTTGFTSGIAVVIGTMQIKDFCGLRLPQNPEHFLERVVAFWQARTTFQGFDLLIGALTLTIIILWPKLNRRIPAPLIAIPLVGLIAFTLAQTFPHITISTIANRFGEIPQEFPKIAFPWLGGSHGLTWSDLRHLLPSAFVIAMLAAIESLLSAVIADGLTGTRHNPNSELVALGLANIACPFFGGIPATGAIARTATNIRYGAQSPIAAIVHAIFVMLAILCAAPIVSKIPLAALAALLLLTAYNMSELKHFRHILKVAPRSDIVVLLTCFSLTVIFDMVIGVGVGIVLAALLFMRRMADFTSGRVLQPTPADPADPASLPDQVILYEIAGPLFFGATRRAIDALDAIAEEVRVVIFDMQHVPVMDVTGLVALETTITKLLSQKRGVILSGVTPAVKKLIARSEIAKNCHDFAIVDSHAQAINLAKKLV